MDYYIALDGTDSKFGGCTTWTGVRIIDNLIQNDPNIRFLGYPKLIRLNPNIPIKTRGNGAVTFHISSKLPLQSIIDISLSVMKTDIHRYRKDMDIKAGLIITTTLDKNPSIYYDALQYYLDYKQFELPDSIDFKWPDHSPSHIGAWAALHVDFTQDFTYEIINYRRDQCFGKGRIINLDKLFELSEQFESTFSSVDDEQNRELICPSGPDPVFSGIRGSDVQELKQFSTMLEPEEELASHCIFQTNQGTDAHVKLPKNTLDPFSVFSGMVNVLTQPKEMNGGHISIKLQFQDHIVKGLFFEPTKTLRDKARNLVPGDIIYLHGGIITDRHGLSIHAEYFSIVQLAESIDVLSPYCKCGQRMTKAGSFSGYKCKSCGDQTYKAEFKVKSRELVLGERCFASPSAQRHLTKPKKRYLEYNSHIEQVLKPSEFRKVYGSELI